MTKVDAESTPFSIKSSFCIFKRKFRHAFSTNHRKNIEKGFNITIKGNGWQYKRKKTKSRFVSQRKQFNKKKNIKDIKDMKE